jgi:hypothetical protein
MVLSLAFTSRRQTDVDPSPAYEMVPASKGRADNAITNDTEI